MKSKCFKCGKIFTYGRNGIVADNGNPICDKCGHVSRDKDGHVWQPGEETHTYRDVATGKVIVVTRAQAFGR